MRKKREPEFVKILPIDTEIFGTRIKDIGLLEDTFGAMLVIRTKEYGWYVLETGTSSGYGGVFGIINWDDYVQEHPSVKVEDITWLKDGNKREKPRNTLWRV